MKKIFRFVTDNPKTVIAAFLLIAFAGFKLFKSLPVDIFPDISVPRITIQSEAGGLTAEEVEQFVTIPIESAVNGAPGVKKIRSSSSGGLSFVWVDFDWKADLTKARFDIFERLSRIQDSLPEEAHSEISPLVSVTGEIMLVALTPKDNSISPLEMREIAEYDLRLRIMSIPGIGEVAVIGARLPEFRIEVDPLKAAERDLSIFEIMEAARATRTYSSAGYLQNVGGDEIPINQIARADTLEEIRNAPVPLSIGGSLKLSEIAEVSVKGEYRRGSASFNGREAVVLSVQKAPGGNTPELTAQIEKALADFAISPAGRRIEVHSDAYRQADFIDKSIKGAGSVAIDAAIVVAIVLLVTLLELRTILIVLATLPFSILAGLILFPVFGIGIDVMTLGGFAVAAGDIVDAAIIFTEVTRRRLRERAALPESERKSIQATIAEAASSVAPSVIFSTLLVAIVFVPLLMLSGLEGKFFRPLALSYISVFFASLIAAMAIVPALTIIFGVGRSGEGSCKTKSRLSPGIRAMRAIYRPLLSLVLKFPKTTLLLAAAATILAACVAKTFGSSFLPPFREDSYNVILALPPGASLAETERISEAAVPALRAIPGVLSVTRRTGRAERDQHAEPVSSSEFVVRIDLNSDTELIKEQIRKELGSFPGCALAVSYPIAHRISAVLSGSEAEIAINIYTEDLATLRKAAAKIKDSLMSMNSVTDVRANREITVRTLRVIYDLDSLGEAGITLKEAGEQVSAAFNGAVVGEVRNGLRKRQVTIRLAGDDIQYDTDTLKSLLLSGKSNRRVRLDEVAEIIPIEAPNLLLREGARRKALVTCNPASGANIGGIVKELSRVLEPIAAEYGVSIEFGGSFKARESAAESLVVISAGLGAVIFALLIFALGSPKAALIALLNIPLGLIGAVAAVAAAHPVLSVSSLVGFVTVAGFLLRNGILLLNCYRSRMAEGESLADAVLHGSEERMAPIILTSLTTVLGLIPIVVSGTKPGGELLSPLAVVQFGGLLGATFLNLLVIPAAAKTFGIGNEGGSK